MTIDLLDARAKHLTVALPKGYAKSVAFNFWTTVVYDTDGNVDPDNSTPKDISGWTDWGASAGATLIDPDVTGSTVTVEFPDTLAAQKTWELHGTDETGTPVPVLTGPLVISASGAGKATVDSSIAVHLLDAAVVQVVQIGGGSGGGGSSAVAAHEAASDPHPQYLTQGEGDGRYDAAGAAAAARAAHEGASDPHPQYLTAAEGNAAYDAAGAAAAARAAHEAASDPHPQYLTASEGNAAYEAVGSVASEAATRAAADTSEATARANAIAAEVTARDAAISTAIANLINSAPGALDTLNELAAALGNDPNFAATITGLLAGKQPLDSDLTAIAALTTTAYGRGLLTLADTAAVFTLLGLGTAATKNVPTSGNATAGQVVLGNDGRLADARTPTPHHASHEAGGTDELALAMSQITGLAAALAAKADVGGVRTWDATTGNLTGLTTDRLILQTGTLTSGGAVYFLPDADSVPGNTPVVILDVSGTVDETKVLTVATNPSASDTIPGALSYGVSFVGITNPYGVRQFRSSPGQWNAVDLAVTTDPDLPGGDATLATCAAVATAIANAIAALPDISDVGIGILTNLVGGLLTINVNADVDLEAIIRATSLDQIATAAANVSFGGYRPINVADPDPLNQTDGANKRYVDGKITTIGDANYTILPTDRTVILTANLTAARTLTLPAAATVSAGTEICILDATDSLDYSTKALLIQRAGSDTIVGPGFALNFAVHPGGYGALRFKSNGSNAWYCISAESVSNKAQTVAGTSGVRYPSDKAVGDAIAALRDDVFGSSIYVLGDADATIPAGTRIAVLTTALTAARTVTLPAASAHGLARTIRILDATGVAGSGNLLQIQRAGSDTIDGALGNVLTWLQGPYDAKTFTVRDATVGAGKWQQSAFEAATNKVTTAMTSASASDVLYPSQKNVRDAIQTGTFTMSNKRITRRYTSLGDGRVATITPPSDTADVYQVGSVNAINQNVTIAAPSGTPNDRDRLVLELKFDGTSRTVTWNATYIAQSGLTLPSPIADTKWRRFEMEWNATRNKWVVYSITQEA